MTYQDFFVYLQSKNVCEMFANIKRVQFTYWCCAVYGLTHYFRKAWILQKGIPSSNLGHSVKDEAADINLMPAGFVCKIAEMKKEHCINILRQNLSTLQKEYGVTRLTLFGSVARGDNTPESDVDLLVEMPPKFLVLCRLHKYLENLLNVSVDLIHRHSRMNPRFLNEVTRDGITIL